MSGSITNEEFERAKAKAEEFYKAVGSVENPYFHEKVHFNAQGLDHVKFKGWRKARPRRDLFMRLRLIPLVPEIIRLSRTVQGLSQTKEFVRRKMNSRWENALLSVSYAEFIAVIDNKRIRVIVRQVEGGEKHFWSVQPFWREDSHGRRKNSYGDIATD